MLGIITDAAHAAHAKVFASTNVESALLAADGRPTGFDYMRLMLTICVIASHEAAVCYGAEVLRRGSYGAVRPIIAILLIMFFSLSGFLVAGSLQRCRTLVTFIGLRVIRILPALAMEVLLSALLLGPLVTSYSLSEYFSDPLFARYFYNLIGHVQLVLPGVFSHNPNPDLVNGQLWTIPYELLCYTALGVLAIIGVAKRPALFVVALFGMQMVRFIRSHPGDWLWSSAGGHIDGRQLVITFLAGVAIYLYRHRVPLNFVLFSVVSIFTLVILLWQFGDWIAPLTAAYSTVYLGTRNPHKWRILAGADYSYGMYIYGYPIQQTYAYLGFVEWPSNMTLSLVTSAAFAAFSWHFIEKPALQLRSILTPIEDSWLKAKERFRLAFTV